MKKDVKKYNIMLKYRCGGNMDDSDAIYRKNLNIPIDGELVYDEIIENYAMILESYATSLDDELFSDFRIYQNLNYCLHYFTLNVLDDYVDMDLDESNLSLEVYDNEHCFNILKSAQMVVERFNSLGDEEMAAFLGTTFYIIADAVYKFENDLKYGQKVYS